MKMQKRKRKNPIPAQLRKYLENTFENISKGEGKVKRISSYGGAIFVTFQNNRTYRMNIELYNSETTLDGNKVKKAIEKDGN